MIRSCWVDQSKVGCEFRHAAGLTLAGMLAIAVIGCAGSNPTTSPSTVPTGAPSLVARSTTPSASPRFASQTAVATPSHGQFLLTGAMSVARANPTAALLADGSVLIFGGCSCTTAALYEPTTGKFVPTGSMNVIRTLGETATLLQDGRVLVTGGDDDSGTSLASAELYDPKSGTFSPTGSMTTARSFHTATLLKDGRVLIAGGFDSSGAGLATAELYDPITGRFVSTGHMVHFHDGHTATLLADGRVLIVGGFGGAPASADPRVSAELYDPKSGSFSLTGSMTIGRYTGHTAALLADGRVLVVGGHASGVLEEPLTSAELYNPKTRTFSPTGSMAHARDGQTATLLANGRVLVVGGADNTAELYEPKTGTFGPTGSMTTMRAGQTATLLADGRVLLAGGTDDGTTAELYQP